MIDLLTARLYYVMAFLLLGVGTYMIIGTPNLVKKIIGMNIFLTAIVVGVSLTAVALGLIVRIYSEYGTLNEDSLGKVIADE